MIEIDGSKHSGSGTIVRLAVMFAALTGQPVHLVNVRARRPKAGLRNQHVSVVQAIGQLVNAKVQGAFPGSMELWFEPGSLKLGRHYVWDIGSAGSTTMLALALLPVLAFGSSPVEVELRGGLFQDFAPSLFHLQHVVLPLLSRMGLEAQATMERPGYVPRGDGILRLTVEPVRGGMRGLRWDQTGTVRRVWGIALASHLVERRVSERMAKSAADALATSGYRAQFELIDDEASLQPGAALAAFVDLDGGARLGADRAGALGRSAESIGRTVAAHLLEDLRSCATLDRHATDQIVPFAALAAGESRFRVPANTEHLNTNTWLAREFLGVSIGVDELTLSVSGSHFQAARS